MEKVIFFENKNQHECLCSGDVYFDFLDYAFKCADYFMLVYVNYYGKGYSAIMKNFKKDLESFRVKTRTNASWPGTPATFCPNTTYKIVFYRTVPEAKAILKRVKTLRGWSSPSYPQDLAFFKKNQCWFYSVGHENIAAIIRATDNDFDFLETKGLALGRNAQPLTEYYKAFDEEL